MKRSCIQQLPSNTAAVRQYFSYTAAVPLVKTCSVPVFV